MATNLGSAALGMLSGGGSVAIQAAIEASKDTPTTQNPSTNIGPQTTGNKVFGTQPGADAMNANSFWSSMTGLTGGGSTLPMVMLLGVVGLVFWLVLRRK